jgi:hypothetical protein
VERRRQPIKLVVRVRMEHRTGQELFSDVILGRFLNAVGNGSGSFLQEELSRQKAQYVQRP